MCFHLFCSVPYLPLKLEVGGFVWSADLKIHRFHCELEN